MDFLQTALSMYRIPSLISSCLCKRRTCFLPVCSVRIFAFATIRKPSLVSFTSFFEIDIFSRSTSLMTLISEILCAFKDIRRMPQSQEVKKSQSKKIAPAPTVINATTQLKKPKSPDVESGLTGPLPAAPLVAEAELAAVAVPVALPLPLPVPLAEFDFVPV